MLAVSAIHKARYYSYSPRMSTQTDSIVLPSEVRFAHVASGARIAWAKSGRGPALVLHAAGDLVMPIERGREMAAAIPGARFETLSTRNHIPLHGDGGFDRFVEVVTDFVAGGTTQLALTPREKALAHAVADGLDNLQIAA